MRRWPHPGGPVVIADTTDNAGGGAPSDNTTFLHRLIARGVQGAAVAPIWDPIAVRLAFDAGEGARLPFRFGGKAARSSGPPVDADVEVIRCVPNAHQTFAGAIVPLGDVASIRMGGVEAVLISTRAQAMGTDLFSNFGIDPKARKILVVKSNQHFYASFSQIAAQVLYAEGDGPLPRDYRKLPWRNIERPIWPLDAETKPRPHHLTARASPWPNPRARPQAEPEGISHGNDTARRIGRRARDAGLTAALDHQGAGAAVGRAHDQGRDARRPARARSDLDHREHHAPTTAG